MPAKNANDGGTVAGHQSVKVPLKVLWVILVVVFMYFMWQGNSSSHDQALRPAPIVPAGRGRTTRDEEEGGDGKPWRRDSTAASEGVAQVPLPPTVHAPRGSENLGRDEGQQGEEGVSSPERPSMPAAPPSSSVMELGEQEKYSDMLKEISKGSWKTVDLEPYDAMAKELSNTQQGQQTTSTTASSVGQLGLSVKLAQMPNVQTICAIESRGTNNEQPTGAGLWMKANPTAKVYLFDDERQVALASSPQDDKMESTLRSESFGKTHGISNAEERLRVIRGSALLTVPNFAVENSAVKCDLLFVGGGFDYDAAVAHINNMLQLARQEFHVLLVHDAKYNCQGTRCTDSAIGEHLRRGAVRNVMTLSENRRSRGATVLQYNLDFEPVGGSADAASARETYRQVMHGSWASVDDVDAYDRFGRECGMGTEEQLDFEKKLYVKLAQMPNVKTICEVASDYRHNAYRWLKANSKAKVLIFDYRKKGAGFFALKDKNLTTTHGAIDAPDRFHHMKKAMFAMPDWHAAHPTEKCDLMIVGNPSRHIHLATEAVRIFKQMANPEFHLVVITSICHGAPACRSPNIEHSQWRKAFKLLSYVADPQLRKRSVAVGQFRYGGEWTSSIQDAGVPEQVRLREDFLSLRNGAWASADLKPFDQLAGSIEKGKDLEGHSAQLVVERKIYTKLAAMPQIKRICEIGFNNGHSASLWLLANPTADVIMFDLWKHAAAELGEKFLRQDSLTSPLGVVNGSARLTIIKGSSLETVPRFALEHPDIKCDLLSVDGGHLYPVAQLDIRNMKQLANPTRSIVVVDDTNCDRQYCVDGAVDQHLYRETFQTQTLHSEQIRTRGLTTFRYQTPLPTGYELKRNPHLQPISDELVGVMYGSWKAAPISSFFEDSFATIATLNKPVEWRVYSKLGSMKHVKTICEAGTDPRHAAFWLMANPTATVYFFGLASNNLSATGSLKETVSDFLKTFANSDDAETILSRLKVFEPPTLDAMADFALNSVDIRCDILSVHNPGDNKQDLSDTIGGLRQLANVDFSLLLVNNVNLGCSRFGTKFDPETDSGNDNCPEDGLHEQMRRGSVRSLMFLQEEPKDTSTAFSVLRFMFPFA